MAGFVAPKVFLIGYTVADMPGLDEYLQYTKQEDFRQSWDKARAEGLSDGECICSMFAKLCYKSLVLGKNDNISRIRDIPDNLKGVLSTSHLSVIEHCNINFVITDCSRVATHEQVRHRVGVAYSQTSGRFCRGDNLDIVFDPILEPIRNLCEQARGTIEMIYNQMVKGMDVDNIKDKNHQKMVTSALRRFLPNGQSNEIAMTLNLRTLRHLIQIRTSRYAEWEIRNIYAQVFDIMLEKYPLMFSDAKKEMVKGEWEVSGMKMQPYEKTLSEYSTDELQDELGRREDV